MKRYPVPGEELPVSTIRPGIHFIQFGAWTIVVFVGDTKIMASAMSHDEAEDLHGFIKQADQWREDQQVIEALEREFNDPNSPHN